MKISFFCFIWNFYLTKQTWDTFTLAVFVCWCGLALCCVYRVELCVHGVSRGARCLSLFSEWVGVIGWLCRRRFQSTGTTEPPRSGRTRQPHLKPRYTTPPTFLSTFSTHFQLGMSKSHGYGGLNKIVCKTTRINHSIHEMCRQRLPFDLLLSIFKKKKKKKIIFVTWKAAHWKFSITHFLCNWVYQKV